MSDRLTSDYMSLEGNAFWLLYLEELKKLRKSRVDMLISVSPEKLARTQGEIYGIDLVLGTPERILGSLKEGHESKEE